MVEKFDRAMVLTQPPVEGIDHRTRFRTGASASQKTDEIRGQGTEAISFINSD